MSQLKRMHYFYIEVDTKQVHFTLTDIRRYRDRRLPLQVLINDTLYDLRDSSNSHLTPKLHKALFE